MEQMTRRTAMAMGALPVLGAAAAYVGAEQLLGDDGKQRSRFARTGPDSARATLQQRHLPNVPLLTSDGERVRFYDDLVKGRKVVLTFVSSRAPAFSATVTRNLGIVQRLFGTRIGKDLFLYSIARNPEHDSPAMLRDWAVWSGAGPGWKFVTGRPADVDRLRHALGFASDDPAQDARPAYSVGQLRYGSEPEMRWAHCQSQAKARVLAHSMLLDFGTGPVDPGSPIYAKFVKGAAPGAPPVWNCHLLLSGLG